jgi:hypothetical protein
VGRRKEIALTVPVPQAGIHVNGLYQDRQEKQAKKKLKFRAVRAPESVCKGKVIITKGKTSYEDQNSPKHIP